MNSEKVFAKLVSGLQNYCKKNNFKKVIFGLSGGIDSSLTVCIAVKALGKENVLALFLPTKFSSKESKEDALIVAKNLGIELKEINIQPIFEFFLKEMKPFIGEKFSKAEENLQARIRANILFTFSNKFNYLVLGTGNKSEILTGYFTLFGDSAAGFALLANLYKTGVYSVAEYVNENVFRNAIPSRVFSKKPSAELRHGQFDQETLPPYEQLDQILKLYCDKKLTEKQIVKKGFSAKIVKKTIAMVKASEFKRRFLPPAIKVTLHGLKPVASLSEGLQAEAQDRKE